MRRTAALFLTVALSLTALADEVESRVLTHYVPQDVLESAVRKEGWTPIALAVNEVDRSRSPNGEEFIYYSATAELDRFAFGISGARGIVGRRLKVMINVQASRKQIG